MSSLLQDFRFAARTLRQSPGFTLVAIATLALGLGANIAIFTYVNAALLRPLPYAEPDRIVRVWEAPPGGGRNSISTLNFLDWQNQSDCFEFLAARTGGSAALTGAGEPILLPGSSVSARYFDVFGIRAARGRTFLDGEDEEGAAKVVVLAHSLWQTQFGGAADIVGRTIQLGGEPHTVVGVLPADCPFERGGSKLWRPLVFKAGNRTRDFHWLNAVGRLKPGVTVDQARAQMDTLGKRIAADFPASNKGWGVSVVPLDQTIVNDGLRQSLYVLFAAVGMVLLIACANLANLSLLRVAGREREIAIRVSLGAGRWVLARQFLTESLLVAVLGGIGGVFVGQLVMKGLQLTMPPGILPLEMVAVIDGRVVAFVAGLTLLTGVVVGLFPAWQAARPSLTQSLKQGGGGASKGAAHARVRAGLVVAEIALAFALLVGSGLLIRSLGKIGEVDPGFDSMNVLTFRLPVSDQRRPDADALNLYLRNVRERLLQLPGVTDVATTSALPMRGWGYGMPFQISDQPPVDRANRRACFFKMVSASYFPTLRIHLRQGRLLDDRDRKGAPPVTVITEAMVKRYFEGQSPLGKRLLVQEIVPGKTQLGDEIGWEIVGVVANEAVGDLDDSPEGQPGMYVTNEQSATYGQSVVLRAAADPALLHEVVKKAVHEIDPDQTLPELKTLDAIKNETLGDTRYRAWLLAIFAGLSLLLSALGIYGVISYSVTQRTREIGIRSALGAGRGDIARLVLRHGAMLTVFGLLLGVGAAYGLSRLLASMLFGVSSWDPVTFAAVAAALAAVALLACLLPARRATKVSPLIALRCD